jgi:antitoxin component of MazEF toxin-antitoxin module
MANPKELLSELMQIEGAICCALVDFNSGMLLEQAGSGVDLEVAAAGNTEVVRAKMKVMKALGLNDSIEDILISLGKQYHIIRPTERNAGLFIYMVLDRARSNLAMARRRVLEGESKLKL